MSAGMRRKGTQVFILVLMAFSWSSSWINVEYGAEAMNESEQDPPKSGVDLVGAC